MRNRTYVDHWENFKYTMKFLNKTHNEKQNIRGSLGNFQAHWENSDLVPCEDWAEDEPS